MPTLGKKPIGNSTEKQTEPKPDPFANPTGDLLIAHIPRESPSHVLVLNKYPVIPNHFILATKESKPQTGLLEVDDLWVAWECLRAWEGSTEAGPERGESRRRAGNEDVGVGDGEARAKGRLFAFFNSGEHSGASQAHRHLQFLPVEDMTPSEPPSTISESGEQEEGKKKWELLIDTMNTPLPPSRSGENDTAATNLPTTQFLCNPNLPFVHYALDLSPPQTPETLHAKYTALHRATAQTIRRDNAAATDHNNQPSPSYNLALTTTRIAICPRQSESISLISPPHLPPANGTDAKARTDAISMSINGTLLAGTLMVKHRSAWDALRDRGGGGGGGGGGGDHLERNGFGGFVVVRQPPCWGGGGGGGLN